MLQAANESHEIGIISRDKPKKTATTLWWVTKGFVAGAPALRAPLRRPPQPGAREVFRRKEHQNGPKTLECRPSNDSIHAEEKGT
jgi:hypothetical protein